MPDNKPRLLMVDDSRVMRMAGKKMLSGQFDVVVAEDGVEGWEKLTQDESIQVVFSDLSMPNMDGYELLAKIRESEDAGIAAMPVIIVTGAESNDEAREKALECGATDFITKPFNSTDITARATAHANYQRERKRLAAQTTLDSVTGLGNSRFLDTRLRQELAFSQRHGHQLTLMELRIKNYNGLFIKFGRQQAETLLKRVAEIIQKLIRKEDTAARVGLARFVILLSCADSQGGRQLAERLQQQLDRIVVRAGDDTTSLQSIIGLASPVAHPGQTVRSVLDEMDIIMKALKKAKGRRVLSDTALRQGDGSLLPSEPEPPVEATSPNQDMSVDEALQALARGDRKTVEAALPMLRRRLTPLLNLLDDTTEK